MPLHMGDTTRAALIWRRYFSGSVGYHRRRLVKASD
jgi:hypothetical protein